MDTFCFMLVDAVHHVSHCSASFCWVENALDFEPEDEVFDKPPAAVPPIMGVPPRAPVWARDYAPQILVLFVKSVESIAKCSQFLLKVVGPGHFRKPGPDSVLGSFRPEFRYLEV